VKNRGFTLVEVMVALAIMALGLTMLLRATANSVHKAEASRMESVATVLARGKMYDVEEQLRKDGFVAAGNAGTADSGTFEDEGWPQISWKVDVREIDLPSPEQLQAMQKDEETKAIQQAAGSGTGTGTGTGTGSDEMSGGGGMGGIFGMLSMFGGGMGGGSGMPSAEDVNSAGFLGAGGFGIIQQIFKQSIRKVVLTLNWKSLGVDDSMEVVEYVTDPDAMNRVISGVAGANADQYENGTASGSGTGTGTGTGTGRGTGGGFGRGGGK